MDYNQILKEAQKSGELALAGCIPTPVSWVQADISNKPIGEPSELDHEGDSGGAYLTGFGGNSDFIKWCKKNNPDIITKSVYKGYDMSLYSFRSYNGQSAEKMEAFATEFRRVLVENGIQCSVKAYLS